MSQKERMEEFRRRLLELVELSWYNEVFVALNRSFRQVMPDLSPYVGRVLAEFPGFGPKAQALKNWLLGIG